MRHLLFFVLFLGLSVLETHGQTQPFEITFGSNDYGEKAVSVRQLDNRDIYVGGFGTVNSTVNIQFLLSKVSPAGTVLWTNDYGLGNQDYCNYMNILPDSTKFIFAGYTDDGTNNLEGIVMLIDSAGTELWSQTHNFPATNENYHFIESTSDGGFIAAGWQTDSSGSNDAYLVKLDPNGMISWTKKFGGNSNEYAQMVHQTSDGGYIMVVDALSFSNNNLYDIWLIKTDSNGNMEWDLVIGDTGQVNGSQSVIICANGDYLVTGESTIDQTFLFDFTLARVSPAGQLKWFRNLGGATGTDAAFGALELNPNKIVMTGYTTTNSANLLPLDVAIFVVDSMGFELGRSYFGFNSIDIGYDIQPSQDGGLLVAGVSKSSQSDDLYLLSISQEGALTATELSETPGPRVYPNPVGAGAPIFFTKSVTNATLNLYDLQGRLIASEIATTPFKHSWKNAPSPGVYLLVVQGESERWTRKIVVN
jgi:hypothetical protein